jgi:sedoheptulokinase
VDQSGNQVCSVTRTHHASVDGLPAGHAEQNPDQLLAAALDALAAVANETSGQQIQAIGVTGQMHSTVLLDSRQQPIGNVITWQDKRSTISGSSGQNPLQQLRDQVSESAVNATGCRLSPGYMATTLYTLQQQGQWPAECQSVSFVADWIAAQLTGQGVVTDRSHAASSGAFDLVEDCWSSQVMSAANILPEWLPPVRESGEPTGTISQAIAQKTGLAEGIAVCNAIGDNQAAVLSALGNDPGSLLINIGTGGQIVWKMSDFARVQGMDTRYLPSGVSGQPQFMLVGAGLCGGDAYAWINRTVRSWLTSFGIERSEDEVWQVLAAQLEQPRDNLELTCEPYFSGTRPEPDRRAVFAGVDQTNFTPANIALAILQGIARTMHDVYQHADNTAPSPVRSITMSGNGSRRNPLLVKAVAEQFGVPVAVSPCSEEAATGTAMLAGVATGVWADLTSARQIIHDAAGA